ncbi:MAG: sensor histidine kinase [Christensenellales bacterium]|jgi:two-component system sensor histidine kinase YesM
MSQKRLCSLQTILCCATFLVASVVFILIFELARQSTKNFENYIIENQQHEINSAAQSFSADIDILRLLMLNELEDNTLTRLQLYYDSAIFNYSFLEQARLVQRQISGIQNSVSFLESIHIYLLDAMRRISPGSIFPMEKELLREWMDLMGGNTQRFYKNKGSLQLCLSRAPLSSSSPHNAIIVATLSSRALFRYLLKYLPDTDDHMIAAYVLDGNTHTLFVKSRGLTEEASRNIGKIISESESGFSHYYLYGRKYLLTWQQVPSVPLKLSLLTPMSLISEQIQGYRRMVSFACILSALALLGLAYYLQRIVHKPVAAINSALHKVGEGNLSVRLSNTRCREFQEIYNQFNQMTVHLQSLIDREYSLQLLNTESELKQLRYQIRPHFLYNTYFNLRALLINEEYDVAEQMTDILGRYLRYITTSDRDEAALQEEWEHAKAYMEIQKMRFGTRLETKMDPCPPEHKGKLVPRIIIQPLIENAFEHGIKDMVGTGIIKVSFKTEKDQLSIYVDDNGHNISDDVLANVQRILCTQTRSPTSSSVALSNINRRIRILFDSGSGLYISRSPLGGFRSEIRMIGEKKHASNDDC